MELAWKPAFSFRPQALPYSLSKNGFASHRVKHLTILCREVPIPLCIGIRTYNLWLRYGILETWAYDPSTCMCH